MDTLSFIDLSNMFQGAINYNESSYPFFPSSNDDRYYNEYMETTSNIMESWLYTQGFYENQCAEIPDSFFVKLPRSDALSLPKTKTKIEIPFVTLLSNLGGNKFGENFFLSYEKIYNRSRPEMVNLLWNIYNNLKLLLMEYGACLACVEVENLLSYDQYSEYMTYILPISYPTATKNFVKDENQYHLLNKQSWLDLLLQTYKVIVLARVPSGTFAQLQQPRIRPESSTMLRAVSKILNSAGNDYENTIYHPIEYVILYWLEFNYNTWKHEMWQNGAELPNRTIKLLDYDLSDGIVLAVATIVYCPYLKDLFADFYLVPESYEQAFYNAVVLIQAWETMCCTFAITPSQIIKPNSLQMFLLCCYLYDFLPNLYPFETIEIKTPLSTTASTTITISNDNMFPVKYSVLLFHNTLNSFEIRTKEFVVKARRKATVEVTYHAKQLRGSRAELILSGETRGFHYAKSMAYQLVGIADVTAGFVNYHVKCGAFGVNIREMAIQCPYAIEAQYEVYIAYEINPDMTIADLVPWKNLDMNCIRRFHFPKPYFKADDSGESSLHLCLPG